MNEWLHFPSVRSPLLMNLKSECARDSSAEPVRVLRVEAVRVDRSDLEKARRAGLSDQDSFQYTRNVTTLPV